MVGSAVERFSRYIEQEGCSGSRDIGCLQRLLTRNYSEFCHPFYPFFFFSPFFFFHSRENVINESCSFDGTARSLYRCVILLVTVQRIEEPAERRGKASALYRRFHRCLYHIARTNLIATDIITGAQRRTDRARVSWKSYVINHQGQNELAREKCHIESLASSHSALDCFRFSVRRVAENSIALSMSVAYAPIKTLLILITFHVIAPRKERGATDDSGGGCENTGSAS